jgi:two-component system, NtrC family, response regulator HupR/HoxA
VKSSFKWSDFYRLHGLRRLKQTIEEHLKVQVNFVDAKGYLQTFPKGCFFPSLNSACEKIIARKDGLKGCLLTVKENINIKKDPKQKETHSYCHAGYSTIVVPVCFKGKFLGTIFVDGFVVEATHKEQKQKIKAFLSQTIKNKKSLVEALDSIPVLSKAQVSLIGVFLRSMLEEILLYQADLIQTQSRLEANINKTEGKVIGSSVAIKKVLELVARVAKTHASILIEGESGTGKELIAKAIHNSSEQAESPLVSLNCGALSESVLESELFGYEKGAFTGAYTKKVGFFEYASSGTLFLDEISETPVAMQIKLLRVLQDRVYIPVGSTREKKTQARFIFATNKNLQKLVAAGKFREDLYYRLNVIHLKLPPLRERREDIAILVQYFLQKKSPENQNIKNLTSECYKVLSEYSWPGNIRELENEIEKLCVLTNDREQITTEFISEHILETQQKNILFENKKQKSLADLMVSYEKKVLQSGLQYFSNTTQDLAKYLGISEKDLRDKLKKLGLEEKDKE